MQVGDVVRLKSGGPWMTVESIDASGAVSCIHFVGSCGCDECEDGCCCSNSSSSFFVHQNFLSTELLKLKKE